MERLGRFKHPVLGRCVRVACVIDGKREEWIFPEDQRGREKHPKHPTGYNPNDINHTSCFSPSLSFYGDLMRYASFKFQRRS